MSTPYPTSDQPPRSSGLTDDGLPRSTGSSTSSGMGSSGVGSSGVGSSGLSGSGYTSGTEDTVSRVRQGAHDTIDRLADKAAPVIERVKSSMSGVSDSMHGRGEQWAEMQDEWMESCRTTVREHPLAALGVAVVAGMVLSKMLSSR